MVVSVVLTKCTHTCSSASLCRPPFPASVLQLRNPQPPDTRPWPGCPQAAQKGQVPSPAVPKPGSQSSCLRNHLLVYRSGRRGAVQSPPSSGPCSLPLIHSLLFTHPYFCRSQARAPRTQRSLFPALCTLPPHFSPAALHPPASKALRPPRGRAAPHGTAPGSAPSVWARLGVWAGLGPASLCSLRAANTRANGSRRPDAPGSPCTAPPPPPPPWSWARGERSPGVLLSFSRPRSRTG